MEYTTCTSAIFHNDKIIYYKCLPEDHPCSVGASDDNQMAFKRIFGGKIGFGITASNENKTMASRVKNCINNAALLAKLKKIAGAVVEKGMCFMGAEHPLLEPGFVVFFPQQANFSNITSQISSLANEHKQTYFFRYQSHGDKVIQELMRSESLKVVSTSYLMNVPGPEINPAFFTRENNALFHSVDDSLRVLSQLGTKECEEVLRIAEGSTTKKCSRGEMRYPFVVIEGLDATGKTTLTEKLRNKMSAVTLRSPPDVLRPLRAHFDSQPDLIRRAYYAVGNYIAAQQIYETCQQRPVIMDRFWHSTAAYTIATETAGGDVSCLPPQGHWAYQWPRDMVKPHVVLFLNVSEEIRDQRLRGRSDVAITLEERNLRGSKAFRERLVEAYRRMQDPAVQEVDASASPEDVAQAALQVITASLKDQMPSLHSPVVVD